MLFHTQIVGKIHEKTRRISFRFSNKIIANHSPGWFPALSKNLLSGLQFFALTKNPFPGGQVK